MKDNQIGYDFPFYQYDVVEKQCALAEAKNMFVHNYTVSDEYLGNTVFSDNFIIFMAKTMIDEDMSRLSKEEKQTYKNFIDFQNNVLASGSVKDEMRKLDTWISNIVVGASNPAVPDYMKRADESAACKQL